MAVLNELKDHVKRITSKVISAKHHCILQQYRKSFSENTAVFPRQTKAAAAVIYPEALSG
jgi:hypothetical protein